MKKIRIGNDIRISWGITTNGKQESLEGKTLELMLVVYNRVIPISSFTTKGNVVSFDFLGANQKCSGVYTIVCKDTTNGNRNTIDKTDAFELVPHSENEGGTDNSNVALEVVTLATDRDSSTIGKAATISVGEVATLPAGSKAYVKNSGTVNAAILDFGIPSGGDGDSGLDGMGVVGEPSSITFSIDEKGTISSSQDKLITMKAYIGGVSSSNATIKSITATNFKNTPVIESDGCSFYIKGSDLQSVSTTDLDGNEVSVPVTQAQVDVTCKIPDSSVLYTASIRVYVNTQTFYASLVSNQREFKQSYTEMNNSLEAQGTKLEKYYSELKQTAQGISATVASNKQNADGSLEELSNSLSSTASSLTSTIEANKTEVDGTIETMKTDFKQTTDSITSTVEANKTAADESVVNLKSEIKQTTDSISTTVEANKTDVDGKITTLTSQVSQNTEQITIANNRFNSDGSLKNTSGLLTTSDKAELASREYVDGKVVNEATITTMINNGISTASIKADQIDFTGHSMNFKSGEITITSDGFTLDKDGNATFSGDLIAKSIRLKVCDEDNVLSGSLILGTGTYTFPELEENVCVNLKLVAPMLTTVGNYPRFYPKTENVYFWTPAWQSSSKMPTSETLVLEFGIFDIVGYGENGKTYWIISKS